jgi:uncharacterized Zn finger protein
LSFDGFSGISDNGMGYVPIICKGCKRKLGVLQLVLKHATADIQVECKDCGEITKGFDIWFELSGNLKKK